MWDPGGGRSLNSRLEAAPTESLSNGNLDFPDKQANKFVNIIEPFSVAGLLLFNPQNY
jgi:hypothetical protein